MGFTDGKDTTWVVLGAEGLTFNSWPMVTRPATTKTILTIRTGSISTTRWIGTVVDPDDGIDRWMTGRLTSLGLRSVDGEVTAADLLLGEFMVRVQMRHEGVDDKPATPTLTMCRMEVVRQQNRRREASGREITKPQHHQPG